MESKTPTLRDLVFVAHNYFQEKKSSGVLYSNEYEYSIAVNLQLMALREIELKTAQEKSELGWLRKALPGEEGSLEELRAIFRARVLNGEIPFEDKLAQIYIWSTCCDSLDIDNPRYASYAAFRVRQDPFLKWFDM
jgi:hypothetical protein